MLPIQKMVPLIGKTGHQNIDARFHLNEPYLLAMVRVHFSGTGTTTADLTLSVDSWRGSQYDGKLASGIAVGLNAASSGIDWKLVAPLDYAHELVFDANPKDPHDIDKVHISWTNPDAGNITWGVTVGLIPLSALG